jgi:hypothetical protein
VIGVAIRQAGLQVEDQRLRRPRVGVDCLDVENEPDWTRRFYDRVAASRGL